MLIKIVFEVTDDEELRRKEVSNNLRLLADRIDDGCKGLDGLAIYDSEQYPTVKAKIGNCTILNEENEV